MEKYIPILIAGLALVVIISTLLLTARKERNAQGNQSSSDASPPDAGASAFKIVPYFHVSLVVAVTLFMGVLVLFPIGVTLRPLLTGEMAVDVLVRILVFSGVLFLGFVFSLLKRNLD